MVSTRIIAAIVLGLTLSNVYPGEDFLTSLKTGHELLSPPSSPQPTLHVPFRDPVFGTQIMRITDRSQVPGAKRVRHYYSKANPFNADGSYAVVFTDQGNKVLYDTKTWRPYKELKIISGNPELQWHPNDPNILYHLDFINKSPDVRGMFRYDIRTDQKTLLRDFGDYDEVRGRLEGNMDKTGRYYALIGRRGKDNLEAFVYDVKEDKISKKIPATWNMLADWISVSAGGKYVVMMGKDRSRIYDIQMNHLRDLPKGSFGHADLCLKADGTEVMVFDGADLELDHNRNINMADLATGKLSILVRFGWGSTPHVSCRNHDLPGWALISTQGPDKKYPNHDYEIFWVKLDGSGEVRRVAHHHSSRARGGYWAEQHAVVNRRGDRIVFASNWGGSEANDYLIVLDEARTGPGTKPKSP